MRDDYSHGGGPYRSFATKFTRAEELRAGLGQAIVARGKQLYENWVQAAALRQKDGWDCLYWYVKDGSNSPAVVAEAARLMRLDGFTSSPSSDFTAAGVLTWRW